MYQISVYVSTNISLCWHFCNAARSSFSGFSPNIFTQIMSHSLYFIPPNSSYNSQPIMIFNDESSEKPAPLTKSRISTPSSNYARATNLKSRRKLRNGGRSPRSKNRSGNLSGRRIKRPRPIKRNVAVAPVLGIVVAIVVVIEVVLVFVTIVIEVEGGAKDPLVHPAGKEREEEELAAAVDPRLIGTGTEEAGHRSKNLLRPHWLPSRRILAFPLP